MTDITKMKEKVDGAKLELAKCEERRDMAAATLKGIREEIEALGFDPDSLKDDIAKVEKELEKEEAKIKKILDKVGSDLDSDEEDDDDDFADL